MTKDEIQINQHINLECSNYNKLLTIFFALIPIIYSQPFYYNSSPGFITGIFLIILFTVDIGNKKNDLIYKFDKYYFFFIVYIVFNSLLLALSNKQYFNLSNLFKGNIVFVIYFGLVVIFSTKMNFNFFLRIYKYICIVIILGLIVQNIFFYIFGICLEEINNVITFIKLFHGREVAFYRPSFIFLEPAHLIYYIIPLLFYELHCRKNIIFPIFLTIGILLSTSSSGVILVIMAWLWNILKSLLSKKDKGKVIVYLIALLLIAFFSLNFTGVRNTIERTKEGGSIYSRVYRGFMVFNKLPANSKLTGVGLLNLGEYTYRSDVEYDEMTLKNPKMEYANTFAYILCTVGIIGFLIFFVTLIHLFFISKKEYRFLVFIFIYLCFTGSHHGGFVWILYLSIIYKLIPDYKLVKIKM